MQRVSPNRTCRFSDVAVSKANSANVEKSHSRDRELREVLCHSKRSSSTPRGASSQSDLKRHNHEKRTSGLIIQEKSSSQRGRRKTLSSQPELSKIDRAGKGRPNSDTNHAEEDNRKVYYSQRIDKAEKIRVEPALSSDVREHCRIKKALPTLLSTHEPVSNSNRCTLELKHVPRYKLEAESIANIVAQIKSLQYRTREMSPKSTDLTESTAESSRSDDKRLPTSKDHSFSKFKESVAQTNQEKRRYTIAPTSTSDTHHLKGLLQSRPSSHTSENKYEKIELCAVDDRKHSLINATVETPLKLQNVTIVTDIPACTSENQQQCDAPVSSKECRSKVANERIESATSQRLRESKPKNKRPSIFQETKDCAMNDTTFTSPPSLPHSSSSPIFTPSKAPAPPPGMSRRHSSDCVTANHGNTSASDNLLSSGSDIKIPPPPPPPRRAAPVALKSALKQSTFAQSKLDSDSFDKVFHRSTENVEFSKSEPIGLNHQGVLPVDNPLRERNVTLIPYNDNKDACNALSPTLNCSSIGVTGGNTLDVVRSASSPPSFDVAATKKFPDEGEKGRSTHKQNSKQDPSHVKNMFYFDPIYNDSGMYTGEVDSDMRPHGKGKMKYENGIFYEGRWQNGMQDSKALIQRERILSGFSSWRGQLKNHGKGATSGGCTVYGMEWIDFNGMSGRYTGAVDDNNVPNGKGIMKYDFGLIAEGEWVKGVLNSGCREGLVAVGGTVVPGGSVFPNGIPGRMTVADDGGMSVVSGLGMMSISGGGVGGRGNIMSQYCGPGGVMMNSNQQVTHYTMPYACNPYVMR